MPSWYTPKGGDAPVDEFALGQVTPFGAATERGRHHSARHNATSRPPRPLVERIPVTAFNAETSVERDTTCSICLSDMRHGENVKELGV